MGLRRLSQLAVPAGVVGVVLLLVVPLPAVLLDFLIALNIVSGLLILMVAMYVRRPLDFSVFPTVILGTTMMRLTLNVASTRVVLLHGHEGTGAAGST